ncbi:MAG: hypothetical protein QXT16_04575 [Candidatus Caldarchaeum sp.]
MKGTRALRRASGQVLVMMAMLMSAMAILAMGVLSYIEATNELTQKRARLIQELDGRVRRWTFANDPSRPVYNLWGRIEIPHDEGVCFANGYPLNQSVVVGLSVPVVLPSGELLGWCQLPDFDDAHFEGAVYEGLGNQFFALTIRYRIRVRVLGVSIEIPYQIRYQLVHP